MDIIPFLVRLVLLAIVCFMVEIGGASPAAAQAEAVAPAADSREGEGEEESAPEEGPEDEAAPERVVETRREPLTDSRAHG